MNNSTNKNEQNLSKLYEKLSAYSFLKNRSEDFPEKKYMFFINILVCSNLYIFFFTPGKPPNIFNNCFLEKNL